MVTGSYKITFTDEKAPKISCKYSEVNREIIFTSDVEISDSYSVELIIVKPDNTFTISTGVIVEGEIIVTIPSQATVVKGVGQYLIRIFDNTTNIYSAYGDIWIDDNLLTDDIIDSIAEVNGNIFPDDFALKSEIPSVDGLIDDDTTATDKTWSSDKIADEIESATPSPSTFIDDNEVLTDKTWSSDKISYELGNVQPFHVYTSTEQPVGRWTDGTMVYEMTIEVTNINYNSPVQLTIPTDVNIKEITGIGRIFLSNRFYYMPVGCVSGAGIGWNGIKIDCEPKYSRLTVNLNAPSGSSQTYVQITIRYTK